jgi:ribosomal protein L11 methylase PrmA
MHAKSISRHEKQASTKITDTQIPKDKHISLIKSLRHLVSSIKSNSSQTQWEDYEHDNNYSAQAISSKEQVVGKYLALSSSKLVLDIGSNTGNFSRLAATYADHVISIDKDWNASNIRFSRFHQDDQLKNKITSFICDLIDPSPSLGWACEERKSIFERLSSDCVLFLAVLHHLVISHNIPMEKVAKLLSEITEKLIIEFVPRTDSQVVFLAKNIKLDETRYSQDAFEKAFSKYFTILDSTILDESNRVIFHMTKSANEN